VITLYGIANCDTVRKARRWLDGQGIAYRFHDFRKDGIGEAQLRVWTEELGWETLLNRRGTTWRAVPDAVKAGLDAGAAIRLMLEMPAIIKRPVLDLGDRRVVGYSESHYQSLFARR
jgi:Spx/MgsR family transcriptional regulator